MNQAIIDIHIHLHPDRLFRAIRRWFKENSDWDLQHPTSPAEVCDVLRKNNVERFAFCSYAHKTEMASDLNEWLLHTAVEIDNYGLPLATVHVGDVDTFKMLDKVMERGAIGLKIHEDVQQFGLDDRRLTESLNVVGAHNGFVLAHVGPIPWDNDAHGAPQRIEKVVANHPQVKFVIAHLGVPDTKSYLELTSQYPNRVQIFDNHVDFRPGMRLRSQDREAKCLPVRCMRSTKPYVGGKALCIKNIAYLASLTNSLQ